MREIKGNIKGIRDSVIAELQKLYDMQSPQLVSQELAVKLADITEYITGKFPFILHAADRL